LSNSDFTTFDTPAIVDTLDKALAHAFLPDLKVPQFRTMVDSLDANLHENHFQKQIVDFLLLAYGTFNGVEFISRRMARWRPHISSNANSWWDFCGAYFIQMWCADLAGSPQCVIAASLKTSLNGWCCSRRFQKEQLRCVFGCGSKQDCIEHYLRCSCVELLWQQLFQEDWGEFESRLAVGCADINGRVRRAFFLHALFCAYNHFRHKEGGFDFGICRSTMQFRLGRLG